jgi:HD-like signal output (HDOD) protein
MKEHRTIKLIKESNYLPEVPKSFGEILNMLLEPYNFHMDEFVEKFSKHPELAKVILQVINYNSRLEREIDNIRDAVVYLGAKNVKIIAISFITRLLLPDRKGRAKIFDNTTYWKHSIGGSIAGFMIADKTGLCNKEKMFTYGLIHDIGVTVLDICLPEQLDKIRSLQNKGVHQIAAEKIVLGGITHAEIGLWLCKEWGLPDEIAAIVGYHHTPLLTSEYTTEVYIMYLADAISTNYYRNLMGDEKTFNYSEKIMESLGIAKSFVDDIIRILPVEVEKVKRKIEFNF